MKITIDQNVPNISFVNSKGEPLTVTELMDAKDIINKRIIDIASLGGSKRFSKKVRNRVRLTEPTLKPNDKLISNRKLNNHHITIVKEHKSQLSDKQLSWLKIFDEFGEQQAVIHIMTEEDINYNQGKELLKASTTLREYEKKHFL